MSAFADAIRAAQADPHGDFPLVLTPRRYAWLDREEKDRVWNDRAIEHMVQVKRGAFQRPRHGRFSPSGLSTCHRRQTFSFLGLPQTDNDSFELKEISEGGKATHLDWQGDGFTEGYMLDAEVWVYEPSLLAGGSLDGILFDGSIFELKSVTGVQFDKVTHAEMRLSWRLQLAIYWLLADSMGLAPGDFASLVVTTRDFGKFQEFRMRRNGADERLALSILRDLGEHLAEGTLPGMLRECQAETGPVYARCPYKRICPAMRSSIPDGTGLYTGPVEEYGAYLLREDGEPVQDPS